MPRGIGSGSVEYIDRITFYVNTPAGITINYQIEAQQNHPEISYPRSFSVPAGSTMAAATQPSYSGQAYLTTFMYDQLDQPLAVRIRVTAPNNYTGAWQTVPAPCTVQ